MSKHLTLSGLQTVLPPIKHLIDKKAENVDWNENDPNAKGYVKNRPFYETLTEEIIFNHQNLEFEDWDGIYGAEVAFPSLTVGNQYNIIWDEEIYNCTPIPNPSNETIILIGNEATVGGTDTGEPFTIINYSSAGGAEILTPDTSLTHTIQISSIVSEIKKIDKKFLPESPGKFGEAEGAEIFNSYSTNIAIGEFSHVEGAQNLASGTSSHVEGLNNEASGWVSHAEGHNTLSSGDCSHAEGQETNASGNSSHAEGYFTIARGVNQHVQGRFNVEDSSYAHIVGNGSSSARSNAHTLDWDGNAWFAGEIYIGGTQQSEGEKIAKISDVPNNLINGNSVGSLRAINTKTESDIYSIGLNATSLGDNTEAHGFSSFVSGESTISEGANSFVIGKYNKITDSSVNSSETVTKENVELTFPSSSDFYRISNNTEPSRFKGTDGTYKWSYLTSSQFATYNFSTMSPGTKFSTKQAPSTIYYTFVEYKGGSTIIANVHYADGREALSTYAHIVGNGTDTTRSNAHTLDWSGNAWYQGDVYVGGSGQDDAAAKKLATEEFVAAPKSSFTLVDQVTGENYVVCIRNGSLVTYKAE